MALRDDRWLAVMAGKAQTLTELQLAVSLYLGDRAKLSAPMTTARPTVPLRLVVSNDAPGTANTQS